MANYQKSIAKALLEISAVNFVVDKPVTFKSGLISPVYIDNRKLPFYPLRWRTVFDGFEQIIEDKLLSYDILAGVESAGIPHSSALGFVLKRPSVFVRKAVKDHGTKKLVEGGEVENKKVLLIEDHVSTGSSSLKAIESIRKAGGMVTDCLSITSYEFKEVKKNFSDQKVKLYTLTNFSAIFDQALILDFIAKKDMMVVKDWIKDPWNWAKKYGHE